MTSQIATRCQALIQELGLGDPKAVTQVAPLTGGVASDIAKFDLGGRTYCVKFALPKLKVAEDWHAPVHRNAAEYAWLHFAAEVTPDSAVELYGRSENQHGFVMEFISGEDVYLWKTALLEAVPPKDEIAQVARLLGQLQAASKDPAFDAATFQNRDDFRALRIEPYLTFTATVHPEVAPQLHSLADMLYDADNVLVHGDVSPKNILFRKAGPVFLDAECATMGDASFDPAFCLNHLVLKAIHLPQSCDRLLKGVQEFRDAYFAALNSPDAAAIETRISQLLPALMLARVDGKSPVEYLSEDSRSLTRSIAMDLIRRPATTLSDVVSRIRQGLV